MLIFVICLIKWRKHFSVVPLYAAFCRRVPGWQRTLCFRRSVSSLEHGVSSVPRIVGALSDVFYFLSFFFFFLTLLNTSLYLEYLLSLRYSDPAH